MAKTSETPILIVDDNPQNLQLFGSVLKKHGFKPLLAQNGKSAIAFVERNTPDLVLLDVMMPGMNGYEVCQHLKSQPATANIPIIFITAKTEPEDILEGFNAGGVDYIAKPFNIPELVARVSTHVKLKHAQDTINQQKEILEQLNQSKDRLFSIIGHDLRNPFGGIISFSNLLSEEYFEFSDEEKIEMIQTINKSAHQGHRLLENLLDWSRSHAGTLDFTPQKVNLKEQILQDIDLLRPFAAQKNIELQLNIDETVHVTVDSEMFSTILRNLISNAIKFTPNYGKVNVTALEDESETILEVKDTGVGIPDEAQCKILDLGSKYSSSGTAKEEGTGLGLMLVQEFVQKHNGKVWFTSKANMGTSFFVAFPN